jgi:hypothetical protein
MANSVKVADIVDAVRYRIDEIGANDSDMIGTDKDDEELTSIIQSVIPDAYRLVMLGADVNMLEGSNDSTGLEIDADSFVAKKKVPSDFLRLISVRLKSWLSAASDVVKESSAEYRQLSDPYAGADMEHPVAALVYDGADRYFELYKAANMQDALSHFVYVKIPESGAEALNIPKQLVEAVAWYAAGLTLVAVRDSHADKCLEVAKGLMGGE